MSGYPLLTYRARRFAKASHHGQVDDVGLDYFEAHILPVAKIVELVTDDEEIIAAAYLHDILEDTATSPGQLKQAFGGRVQRLVIELTKVDGKFPNLKSRDAALIKFADRLQNLSRMQSWDQARQNAYLRKSSFWRLEQ